MTVIEYASRPVANLDTPLPASDRFTVVLCGSYRRLRECFEALLRDYCVLSPVSVDFVDDAADFVRLPDERTQTECAIEEAHLSALKSADFVWLHAPDGYVGPSAAMELGHAWALGIPVICCETPRDPIVASKVTVVGDVSEVHQSLLSQVSLPGQGLERLQRYYRTAADRRGWSNESAKDTLLLLTEELGELARAVRKLEGIARHQPDVEMNVGDELADMQLYLVHLANSLGLDLAAAVTRKEVVNSRRFERASRVA